MRPPLWIWAVAALFVAALAILIAASVRRPGAPMFPLSPLQPRDPPAFLTGPDTVTLDVRDGGRWVRFDLARRRMAGAGEPWDLAVRRHRMIVNGGDGFLGRAGVQRVPRPIGEVTEAPADGYQPSRVTPNGDSINAVLDGWYAYGFFSHLLEPEPGTFVLRAADGRYAKLAVLSYYCPGLEAGCMTVTWTYQGDGTRRLVAAP